MIPLKGGRPSDSELYSNPIMAGDFPDPSILRDGDDYYMTCSSGMYSPALLYGTRATS